MHEVRPSAGAAASQRLCVGRCQRVMGLCNRTAGPHSVSVGVRAARCWETGTLRISASRHCMGAQRQSGALVRQRANAAHTSDWQQACRAHAERMWIIGA